MQTKSSQITSPGFVGLDKRDHKPLELEEFEYIRVPVSSKNKGLSDKEDEKKVGFPETTKFMSTAGMIKGIGKRNPKGGISLPPAINITSNSHFRAYFGCTSSNIRSVSGADILGSLGGICTVANSTIQPWASTFRIRSVRVWPSASASAVLSADLYWSVAGSYWAKDEEKIRAIPTGVTETGMVEFVPPKQSLASFWTGYSTGNIFTMYCQVGSVVELNCSFTLQNSILCSSITGIVTASLGTVYYLALDGAATNSYTPIGLPSTH